MNDLTSHIKYLVRRNDRVSLPGIGVLVGVELPAFYGTGPDMILPPTRTLYLDREPTDDWSALTQSYARRNRVAADEAELLARADIERLKEHLAARGMVMVPGVGQLYLKSGAVEFKAAKHSWGFNPFYIFEGRRNVADNRHVDEIGKSVSLKNRAVAMLGTLAWAVVCMAI